MGFGGGGGGSYEPPAVEPLPEKLPTKGITASATSAYQGQKDRQKKNRGLYASILTQKAGALAADEAGKSTLG